MTQTEYELLANDLQNLVKRVPLQWGAVQNDALDNQIEMFKIDTFLTLEERIAHLPYDSKKYLRRRWFLWKASICDEYIFCMNKNVSPNPNGKDQQYDIEFNNDPSLRFDVKGTVIPKKFRTNINEVVGDPTEMINFFYDKQSTGVRSHYQNRIFIVHHSYKKQDREMILRCHWKYKTLVYNEYANRISTNSKFAEYKNTKSDVVFIFENVDNTYTHSFFAVR